MAGYKHKSAATSVLCYDKVFNMGPTQGRIFVATRKLCHNIKFKVHNKGQQDFVKTKMVSVAKKKKHEVEMNSITTKKSSSRQEVEEQYKKTVATKKFMLRHNRELKVESLLR